MAKKSKSKRTVSNTSAKTRVSRVAKTNEFNPDYSYVIADLKRIGILAISFIAILIVLSFFL
ncbi:MAG: hypothetical protein JEZ06_10055 [Anaerolineaceae bacterium]|nr:hypothetical protein [Anaerolineaceae bacterium]